MNLDKKLIEQAVLQPHLLLKDKYINALKRTVKKLATGELRVAKEDNHTRAGYAWKTESWLIDAISLAVIAHQFPEYRLRQFESKKTLKKQGIRSLVEETVRYGAFVDRKCVLMKSFVNIGAHIGVGSMIDTWASVGAGAQIGVDVHISGGVSIGGVLEPRQSSPVIIGDYCFIGARSVVSEGVHIGEGSILSSGVTLSSSTRIYDSRGGKTVEFEKGIIPINCLVIPATYSRSSGTNRFCAEIVKSIDPVVLRAKGKTGINQLLREFNVSL